MCTPSRRLLSRTFKFASSAGVVAAVLALAGTAWAGEGPKNDEVFKLTTAIQVPGPGKFFSFDIAWIDTVLNKLFLADRNNKAIDAVDLTTKNIHQFTGPYAGFTGNNDTSGPDGVLVVDHKEIYVGDSNTNCSAGPPCTTTDPVKFPTTTPGSGRVWVLDATNPANLVAVPPGATNPILVGGHGRADELCFDPRNHLIMIASPADGFVTFIDTNTKKIAGQLIFDGSSLAGHAPLNATNGLEQCGWSPVTGKFYQNVPEVDGPGDDTAAGAVAVIDPKTMKVETSFPVPLDACAGPQGMAFGPNNQILLGCNAASPNGHRNLAIINLHSGAVMATIPDLGGADAVWFNEHDGHYFIPSCNTDCRTAVPPPGTTEVLGVIDAKGHRLDQSAVIASVTTTPTATTGNPRTVHSGATNPITNETYVPIPAPGGRAPAWAPTLCESAPNKVDTPLNANGCIVVFAPTNPDDRSRFSQERGQDDKQE